MGRHKIAIKKIPDARGRHVTFNKRKNGLLKKAMELSLLCDCQIALVIFEQRDEKTNPEEKLNLVQYATTDMDDILLRYSKKQPTQSLSNKDYVTLYPGAKNSSSSSSSSSSTSSTSIDNAKSNKSEQGQPPQASKKSPLISKKRKASNKKIVVEDKKPKKRAKKVKAPPKKVKAPPKKKISKAKVKTKKKKKK